MPPTKYHLLWGTNQQRGANILGRRFFTWNKCRRWFQWSRAEKGKPRGKNEKNQGWFDYLRVRARKIHLAFLVKCESWWCDVMWFSKSLLSSHGHFISQRNSNCFWITFQVDREIVSGSGKSNFFQAILFVLSDQCRSQMKQIWNSISWKETGWSTVEFTKMVHVGGSI